MFNEWIVKTRSGSFYKIIKQSEKFYIIYNGKILEITNFFGTDINEIKNNPIFFLDNKNVGKTNIVEEVYKRTA